MKINGLFVKVSQSPKAALNFAEETATNVDETYGCFVDMMDGEHTHLEDAIAADRIRCPIAYVVGGRIYVDEATVYFLKDEDEIGYVDADEFMEMIG